MTNQSKIDYSENSKRLCSGRGICSMNLAIRYFVLRYASHLWSYSCLIARKPIDLMNNDLIISKRINKGLRIDMMSFPIVLYCKTFLFHAAKIERFLKIKYNATADEVFDWWISNDSADKYFQNLRFQRKIEFEDE